MSEKEFDISLLRRGFEEGYYPPLNEEGQDDLTIARLHRKSPAEILNDLRNRGLVDLYEKIFIPLPDYMMSSDQLRGLYDDDPDFLHAVNNSLIPNEEERVEAYRGRIVNPDNQAQAKQVVFIAAGGEKEGLVTARGVYQMRYAMEQAQEKGLPTVFLNAITSADPFFQSELDQIPRQISDAMAFGLGLTVPKVTVVTGEAASAGAHACWQIADTTLILDHGALLTVINPEEALRLLRFIPEINAEADQRFYNQLKAQNIELDDRLLRRITDYMQGIAAIEELLHRNTKELKDEDQLMAIVKLAKAVSSASDKETMLIMPADNPRYVEGMLTREADMLTIHADDWQKKAERDTSLAKTDFLSQVKQAMIEAQVRKTQDNTPIYFRIRTDNFTGFWTIDDVKQILRELYSEGLTGIRFTEAATSTELSRLSTAMREVETDLGLSNGTFRICLSVETDEAIDKLSNVIQEGDSDKRVTTIVMGVRDYIKTKKDKGVKDREWNHPLVEQAKIRLTSQIKQLQEGGWMKLRVLHALASLPNDYPSTHSEVARALELGAYGMLAISTEQIPHAQSVFEGIIKRDGDINTERLQEILHAANAYIDRLFSGKDRGQLQYKYNRVLYGVLHEYRLKLLQAGGAFPKELQAMGIVDGIISPAQDGDYGEPLIRAVWNEIEKVERMDGRELRTMRLMKLARIGSRTIRRTTPIGVEMRRRRAEGRGQKAAQYWVDLVTRGEGYDEEILTDLEPDTTSDVLVKMGRSGSRSYAGQVQEAQERTGTLAGIIAGYTKIAGKDILLIVREQDYINATAGASTGEFVRRACLDATRKKGSGQMSDVAICYIDVSAGGRVQEGAMALAPSELAVSGIVEARSAGIPVINIGHDFILGSDGIGPYYQADRLALIGENTELGLAGRRIVEKASPLGKEEFPPGFRLAQYHKTMGNIDALIEDPEALYQYLETTLLSL